jgi:mRNA interferase MazF
MISGIKFEQGSIVIVPFPFTNLRAVKQRPVLILSHAAYNNGSEDIITCGITSNLRDEAYSIIIDNKDLKEGNLPVKSKIKVDKLFTLEKSLVKKNIGKVKREVFIKVKEKLMEVI